MRLSEQTVLQIRELALASLAERCVSADLGFLAVPLCIRSRLSVTSCTPDNQFRTLREIQIQKMVSCNTARTLPV